METELYNWEGDRTPFDEYADRHLRKNRRGGLVLATDMDNTMFANDLGILVFLEKLADPHFWNFDVDTFESLILPPKYYEALTKGAEGFYGEDLPPQLSQLALDLREDIVVLYRLIQRIVKSEGGGRQDQGRVVREFARKMVELDRIFLTADRFLSKLFDGELLMRTRFFAGKDLHTVNKLTQKVMNRAKTDVSRHLDLRMFGDSNIGDVTEERINEIHGKESPAQEIDRYVTVVDDVRFFVRDSIRKKSTIGLVITANLQGIGSTAVKNSPYRFIKDQRVKGQRLKGSVIGSKLIKNGATLGTRMEDKPMFGVRKADKTREFAQEKGRRVACAIGDSPTTDGPMMRASLEDGGTAILVGQDIEELSERFHSVLDIQSLQANARERVYYILAPDNSPR